MEGFKALAAAIFIQAVNDAGHATAAGDAAREWLLKDDTGFSFWCLVIGRNPESVRERLKSRLENGHNRRIDRETIVAFLSRNRAMSNREAGRQLRVSYERVRSIRRELSG